ncbi:MAG: Crp/Fnr family transcriptional regulator [Endozoicomonas sp.]
MPTVNPENSQKHFHTLDPEHYPCLYGAFVKQGTRRTYSRGEIIVFQQETINQLGILKQGSAEIHITSSEGDRIIAERFDCGSVLNAASYLDNGPSPADVVATEDCTVIFLPYKYLRREPELNIEATRLVAHCSVRLYRLLERLFSSAMLLPLEERVVRRLRTLKGEQGQVRITAEKMAAYLGVSKYKIHRILKKLESEGALTTGYGVVTLHC